ncbi:hypothetical protein TNCV_2788651 [Trichonephila clavipes]|uniref:Uncharacterized protein n=1 Tax=Trichonephila clavipes TaxID=2585209 RepID=A0A8X6T1N5_TRICX|nr:hypothetical protein TNCV_2788651 [Trichonephila clavipes]
MRDTATRNEVTSTIKIERRLVQGHLDKTTPPRGKWDIEDVSSVKWTMERLKIALLGLNVQNSIAVGSELNQFKVYDHHKMRKERIT